MFVIPENSQNIYISFTTCKMFQCSDSSYAYRKIGRYLTLQHMFVLPENSQKNMFPSQLAKCFTAATVATPTGKPGESIGIYHGPVVLLEIVLELLLFAK